MCYAFKQRSYWYIYDFLLDILFLRVVTISCVYPSLWIDIIMIFIDLEPYTLERNYISRWYPFFHDHLVFLVLFLWWLREIVCLKCGSYIVASWCTFFVVKFVFLVLVLTRLSPCLLVSLLLTMLSFSIFAMGCHKLCCYFVLTPVFGTKPKNQP